MPVKAKTKRVRKTASTEQEKISTIQAVLATCKKGTADIWSPTEDELGQLDKLESKVRPNANTIETVIKLESKFDSIYKIVPFDLQVCWSETFKKTHGDLVQSVVDAIGPRYDIMKEQHAVASRLFPLSRPHLHNVAKKNNLLSSLAWDPMRQRLSQDEGTTAGKTWLEKMCSLLFLKLDKLHKGRYKPDEDGDLDLVGDSDTQYSDDDSDILIVDPQDKTVGSKDENVAGDTQKKRRRSVSPPSKGSSHKKLKGNRAIDVQPISDSDLNALIGKLEGLDANAIEQQIRIEKLLDFMNKATLILRNECELLGASATTSTQVADSIKHQRSVTEDGKKEFYRSYQKHYRAIYDSYIRDRKLLYSHAWWTEKINEWRKPDRRAAVLGYFNGTHPQCETMSSGRDGLLHLLPVEPRVTIDDSCLYDADETRRRIEQLFTKAPKDVEQVSANGMSLLQLPSQVQAQIENAGDWPADGMVDDTRLPNDLRLVIAKMRDLSYQMHNIEGLLDDKYSFITDDVDDPQKGDDNDETTVSQ